MPHRGALQFLVMPPMDAWPRCLERLEAELPAEDLHTWLKPLQADHRDEATVLYAPNAFVVDHVRAHYLPRIRELLAYFHGAGEVRLEVGALPRPAREPLAPPPGRPDRRPRRW